MNKTEIIKKLNSDLPASYALSYPDAQWKINRILIYIYGDRLNIEGSFTAHIRLKDIERISIGRSFLKFIGKEEFVIAKIDI